MADYTTLSLVRALLPDAVRMDVSTNPGTASLATWITQITNQVNAALLQGGFDVTTLTSDQIGAITLTVTKEASYLVLVARGASSDAQHKPFWASWDQDFKDMLKLMRDGDFAGADTTTGKPWSYTMESASDTTDSTLQPLFGRGKQY